MNSNQTICSPDDIGLNNLCDRLREMPTGNHWPNEKLELLAKSGVYRWFVPTELGGLGWSKSDVVRGYIALSSACLTTTFVLTQRVAALTRICGSPNKNLRDALIPEFLSGESTVTVGISHLTTSRQHMKKPALQATQVENGFLINGFSPWVTGGCGAKKIFMGAQLADGNQILFIVGCDNPSVRVDTGFDLVALTGSKTGAVHCTDLLIEDSYVLFGPCENVLAGTGRATGSFQTSSLAIGLSKSAIDFIGSEAAIREELVEKHQALLQQFDQIESNVLKLASGVEVCTNEELRTEANSLVLRATQSALVAAKGAGFVSGHPVGRWCNEALFFLVWSCPQAVLHANMCEFAGIES